MRAALLCSIIFFLAPRRAGGEFMKCDTDTTFAADQGSVKPVHFTWMGTLQYINVRNGTPHYFRQPRVLLVSRQFVLATAADAARVPDGYALGNVVFNQYERDEAECGVALAALAAGARCLPALLVQPVADVLLHPEYKNFGVRHSIALLKMLRGIVSVYMLPVCLPMEDHVMRFGAPVKDKLYHVDFTFDNPRDFAEEKEISMVTILPPELCKVLDADNTGNSSGAARLACSSGCDQRPGSALLAHERTGHWTLVGISIGGTPCADPLRERRPPPPARHLLLLPYVPWLTAAISGVGASMRDDPFGYVVPLTDEAPAPATSQAANRTGQRGHGWFGHWWMAGFRCFDRDRDARDLTRFYYEVFRVTMDSPTLFTYNLDLTSRGIDTIECVKVGTPWQLLRPWVIGIGTNLAQVTVPAVNIRETYLFHVEGWCISIDQYEYYTMEEE